MIVSHLIYDTPSLLACSMTCYSWYIAAVPHLHHSLTTDNYGRPLPDRRCLWPRPLQKSHEFGLLPLIKRLRIRLDDYDEFTPAWLGRRTLHYFSVLANLQELGIDHLQASAFVPDIRRCFGHFSPTLRFLALKEPKGSCRQILYFIGLFPNLQDLKLNYRLPTVEEESTAGAMLTPLSIPPLRGRLTLTCFAREKLVKEMIALFGGLRFRYLDLFRVECVRLLLDACAETLETLRLYPTDPYGEQFFQKKRRNRIKQLIANNHALLRHFNLSQNRFLRTLETTAESINAAGDTASDFLKTVLSSVTSPRPLDVVIIYRDDDCVYPPPCWECNLEPLRLHLCSQKIIDRLTLYHQRQLRVFREIHSVRDFRLVLCADISESSVGDVMKTLEDLVKAREVEGGLDRLLYKPLIVFERRVLRTRSTDHNPGFSGRWSILASAL